MAPTTAKIIAALVKEKTRVGIDRDRMRRLIDKYGHDELNTGSSLGMQITFGSKSLAIAELEAFDTEYRDGIEFAIRLLNGGVK